jgi:hypothetical protein
MVVPVAFAVVVVLVGAVTVDELLPAMVVVEPPAVADVDEVLFIVVVEPPVDPEPASSVTITL